MKFLLVTLSIMLVAVSADVSHLTSRYLPPNYHMTNSHDNHGMMMMQHQQQQQHKQQQPSNERVETTIEQHEVIELPTQIEIVRDGHPIYGIQQQQPMEMRHMNEEHMPKINSRYLSPSQDIQNLQPPQVPYEMPMSDYLPPVEEITTTDMPTTTMMPPTTTYTSQLLSNNEGETTTEQQYTQEEINNYAMSTTTQEPASETTTTTPNAMPENQYLPPMPQNHYLPPMSMKVMLPPPEPMPQLTYQQYQEQMMREEQMQRMYRDQEMQEMMNAIAEMEQQQMIAVEPAQHTQPQVQQQMQPIVPVEPGHILRDDGYHYKTAADDVRRYRYRN